MKSFKGQSAMEYLMTYGWAILIIAIVLVALFELGIFGGSTLPTACVAQSGFVCSNPVYNGQSITITVGQQSTSEYYSANIIFLNSTELSSFTSSFPSTAPTQNVIGNMVPGSTYTATFNAWHSGGSAAIGTGISGQIWISYLPTSGSSSTQYAEVGTFTGKAT
ncbi:MAG: hypothetical protein QXD23_03125 [Candidatus Micrarchaeaceae archaeon]